MERVCALAVVVLAGAIEAQVASSVSTGTDFGVVTSYAQGFVPGGTAIAGPTSVSATDSWATASATITPGPLGFVLEERGQSTRSLGASIAATARQGPNADRHDLVWTLTGQGSGAIVLTLRMIGGLGTNERLDLTVDVGDDGTLEVVRQGWVTETLEVPVTVAGAVPIRVAVDALAVAPHQFSTSGYSLDLSARFARAVVPVRFANYGPVCGARLVGGETRTTTAHRLRFDVTGGFPRAPVLFVFGAARAAIPIGASGCTLLTGPFAWELVAAADAAGSASLPLTVGALNGVVQVQAFPFDPSAPAAFRATPGLELTFSD